MPNYWLAIIIAITGLLLYANSIPNDYAIDDGAVITDNQFVQQGVKGIPGIFRVDVWHFNNSELGYYRPLPIATYAIEHEFFPNNPHFSHFVNVLLYALTGYFICLLLMLIFRDYHPAFAFIISLLFIAHPIHTEVVANIKSRDEILSFLNMVIAILLLLRLLQKQKDGLYPRWRSILFCSISCLFFYLALLSKETAIVAILILPLILYFTGQNSPLQIAKITIPFFIITLLFLLQKYLVLGSVSGATSNDIVSFPYAGNGSSLANMFQVFLWYVKLVVIPYPLSYNYAYNQIPATDWLSAGPISGLLIWLAIVILCIKELPKKSPPGFGALFFIFTIIPAMAFVFLKGGILAERFLYAPALGFCIVLTWLVYKAAKLPLDSGAVKILKKVSWFIPLALVFSFYSLVTITRNVDWHDDMTLSSHDVNVSPNSCQVHLHYGKKLIDAGIAETDIGNRNDYFNKGVDELKEALNIYPGYAAALFKLGLAYQVLKVNNDSAIYYYKRTIESAPGYARAYNNLGALYEKTGNKQLASYYYNKAAQLNPTLSQEAANSERINQQIALSSNENLDSLEQFTSNKDFNFYTLIGIKYTERGDYIKGLKYLNQAIEMRPNSAEAQVNISVCYDKMKAYDKCEEALLKALQLDANNLQAMKNLVALYQQTGNVQKQQAYRAKLHQLTNH